MKYEGKIVLSNKNNSYTLAFDRIEEINGGRKLNILEVGCSTGYFGAVLVERGHRVWGVEPDLQASEEARKKITGVYTGRIEDFFTGYSGDVFDVIVFGDVLEHLIDPLAILEKSKAFLAEGGVVIASIPNVAHFAIRAMLLEGRWDYADQGILDRTHLRFYTRDSVIDLFSNAAYRVKSIDTVHLSAELAGNLCALNLKKESIAKAEQYADDTRGTDFQYIVVAQPDGNDGDYLIDNSRMKAEAGLRVLCLVHALESPLVDIRIREPLKRWAGNHFGSVRIVVLHEHTVADLQWADVIVFQREANEYVQNLAARIQASGKKVVFEIDDYLLELPPFLGHHEPSLRRSRPYMIDLIRRADALSVSTQMLGKQLSAFNKNLHVTPNYGKPNYNRARHFFCPSQDITLLVASSDSVLVDILVEPLRRIQERYKCRVIGIGPPGAFLAGNGVLVRQEAMMPYTDFSLFLSSLDNAIGIIPLDHSLFSSCKSAVKYFDYSMAGLPSVCSNVLPYADVIEDGVNGFLVDNTTQAWTSALSALIEDSDLRCGISDSARTYVTDHHNLDLTAKAWSGVFDSMNIDLAKTRSCRVTALIETLDLRRVLIHMLRHAVRPSSYVNALSIFRRKGLRGVYEKIRRR